MNAGEQVEALDFGFNKLSVKKIIIYKDFESQKKQEIEESLKMTPIERIVQVVALIKKIYPSIKPNSSKRINFQQDEETIVV